MKQGKGAKAPKRRDIMLQLDISFLLYCFVFLPKALPVAPSPPPPDRHPNYFLTIFPPTNCCELNHFPSTGAGVFLSAVTCARALSLSLSCLSLSLISSRVCVGAARVSLLDILCAGFSWSGRGVRSCSVLLFSSVRSRCGAFESV